MAKKAIVLTFDRLHLGYLGCYGNDWIETPGFDRLAFHSIVFDQHFGESFAANTQRCAWWTGAYQFPRPSLPDARLPTLPAVLQQHGTPTRLACETPPDDVFLALAAGAEQSVVSGRTGPDVDESNTPFAVLVDDSVRWLQTSAGGRDASWLLWLNSRGVPTPWTPPRSCAARYLDRYRELGQLAGATGGLPASANRTPRQPLVDKPPVPPSDAGRSETVAQQRAEDSTADELSQLLDADASMPLGALEWAKLSEGERRRRRILYAAYVTSIDRSISRLLRAIEESVPGDELLLVVAAAAGQPLVECTAFPESCEPPDRRFRSKGLLAPSPRNWSEIAEETGNRHSGSANRHSGGANRHSGGANRQSGGANRHSDGDKPSFWRLCEENVHVPLFVQVGGVEMGSRRQELVQTVDLVPTLIEWFGVAHCGLPVEGCSLLPAIRGETGHTRDYLCLGDGENAEAIRTAEYYLVRPADSRSARAASDDAEPPLLFIKPDDLWEVNDVASQSPDVTAALSATLDGFVQAARKSLPAQFPVRLTGG